MGAAALGTSEIPGPHFRPGTDDWIPGLRRGASARPGSDRIRAQSSLGGGRGAGTGGPRAPGRVPRGSPKGAQWRSCGRRHRELGNAPHRALRFLYSPCWMVSSLRPVPTQMDRPPCCPFVRERREYQRWSSFANEVDADTVFANALVAPGEVLLAISTSGTARECQSPSGYFRSRLSGQSSQLRPGHGVALPQPVLMTSSVADPVG